METKLVRIAEISAKSKHPIFTSVYHLINEDMLLTSECPNSSCTSFGAAPFARRLLV